MLFILLFLLNLFFIDGFNFYSQFNNLKIFYEPLKISARNWFIERSQKKGIDWNKYKKHYKEYEDELLMIEDLTSNKFIYYPTYYKKKFHGYDNGNLNWEATYEAIPATYSISSNYWKDIDPIKSHNWVRGNYSENIKKYYNSTNKSYNNLECLDIGCSVGIGTEFLYKNMPNIKLVGLDLSPFFISLAKFRSKRKKLPINYIHSNAEFMPFKKESYDLITAQFMFHEIPNKYTKNILKESFRVLKNDSVIAIIDFDIEKLNNNTIINFIRRKIFEITEPHIKEYCNTNMTQLLYETGFVNVKKYNNNDPFNSVWIAHKEDPKLQKYIKDKLNEQNILINLKKNKDKNIEADYIIDI